MKRASTKKKQRGAPPKGRPQPQAAKWATPAAPGTPSPTAPPELVESPEDRRSAISLIRSVRGGELAPESLSKSARQRCVEHMTAEGLSTPEIAEVLRSSERTINRDRAAVRAANALEVGEGFIAETLGNLARQAEIATARLRRIGREKDCPHAERIAAEKAVWDVQRDYVEVLRRVGHLPSATQQIRAELSHSLNTPELTEISIEAVRLQQIFGSAGGGGDGPIAALERVSALARRAGEAIGLVPKPVPGEAASLSASLHEDAEP